MKRRTFLKVTVFAAVGALAAPYVHAQSKKFAGITLRVNGSGGVYDDVLRKRVAAPLEEKYGLKIQYNAEATSSALVKLLASRDNPPYDLFTADSPQMIELLKAGVVEEIRASEVPNIKRVLPGFREFGEYGVPFSVPSIIPVYNSNYIKQPLTSYSDIARPDLVAHVVVPAPTFDSTGLYLLGLAEENGGSVSNMEPAYKVLADAKPNIVAIAQATVAQLQMFQNEEAYAGFFWDGRAYELRTKGVPIVSVIPPKGIYSVTSYINIVKGMKYPEAAYAYADQLLSDEGILGLPEALRYGATTDVAIPAEISQDLLFNSPERSALKKKVDWERWTADRSARIERVNKILRS
ncbi:extracellular solute-binding protein [Bradyrhizobium sp. ISRA442]|uniref:extracellular solute-binding protein n=1 Tax=Bradyrhizobium sp. ISRA442 TaxID=2866197 RepID=UPI00311ABB65